MIAACAQINIHLRGLLLQKLPQNMHDHMT
jgi:hypothetical protein